MQNIGDKCVENISRYHLKWERIQTCGIPILLDDNLVAFWIFIQFQLKQSNYVKYNGVRAFKL